MHDTWGPNSLYTSDTGSLYSIIGAIMTGTTTSMDVGMEEAVLTTSVTELHPSASGMVSIVILPGILVLVMVLCT